MGVMIPCIGLALLALSGSLGALSPAHARVETASVQTPDALRAMFADVGFDQRLGAQVPLDLDFREETGRTVRLQEYFGDKPVILVPVYYSCTTVCPMVMGSLTRSLKAVPFDAGKEFRILTLSIDATGISAPLRPDRSGTGVAFPHRRGASDPAADLGHRLPVRLR
jgi:protein SCO1/2